MENEDKKTLPVKDALSIHHVNVRTSIVFLLGRLILLDILATIVALLFFGATSFPWLSLNLKNFIASLNVWYFILLGIVKIGLTIYLVIEWINEYYEITPKKIYHRKGVIWRKESINDMSLVRSIGIQQGVMGRIFNYGTLFFYDRGVYKYFYLNYIHNPVRYLNILKELLPGVDIEKEVIREHVHDEEVD